MLFYGVPTDSADEIVKVGESTKQFVKVVVGVFGDQYLNSLTQKSNYKCIFVLKVG
jgi:hypothetical protein